VVFLGHFRYLVVQYRHVNQISKFFNIYHHHHYFPVHEVLCISTRHKSHQSKNIILNISVVFLHKRLSETNRGDLVYGHVNTNMMAIK
jgi:hypothetical protein